MVAGGAPEETLGADQCWCQTQAGAERVWGPEQDGEPVGASGGSGHWAAYTCLQGGPKPSPAAAISVCTPGPADTSAAPAPSPRGPVPTSSLQPCAKCHHPLGSFPRKICAHATGPHLRSLASLPGVPALSPAVCPGRPGLALNPRPESTCTDSVPAEQDSTRRFWCPRHPAPRSPRGSQRAPVGLAGPCSARGPPRHPGPPLSPGPHVTCPVTSLTSPSLSISLTQRRALTPPPASGTWSCPRAFAHASLKSLSAPPQPCPNVTILPPNHLYTYEHPHSPPHSPQHPSLRSPLLATPRGKLFPSPFPAHCLQKRQAHSGC